MHNCVRQNSTLKATLMEIMMFNTFRATENGKNCKKIPRNFPAMQHVSTDVSNASVQAARNTKKLHMIPLMLTTDAI